MWEIKGKELHEWRTGLHAANPAQAQALVAKNDALKAENDTLREELSRLSLTHRHEEAEIQRLKSEIDSLKRRGC